MAHGISNNISIIIACILVPFACIENSVAAPASSRQNATVTIVAPVDTELSASTWHTPDGSAIRNDTSLTDMESKDLNKTTIIIHNE